MKTLSTFLLVPCSLAVLAACEGQGPADASRVTAIVDAQAQQDPACESLKWAVCTADYSPRVCKAEGPVSVPEKRGSNQCRARLAVKREICKTTHMISEFTITCAGALPR